MSVAIAPTKTKLSVQPCGHRLLIRPRRTERTTSSGVIYKTDVTVDMEKRATMEGEIVGIGPNCWKAFDDGSPWAELGDRVLFSRYAGQDVPEDLRVQIDDQAERLVIVADEDVLMILERAESEVIEYPLTQGVLVSPI